jgi:hypothetical protein
MNPDVTLYGMLLDVSVFNLNLSYIYLPFIIQFSDDAIFCSYFFNPYFKYPLHVFNKELRI